MNKLMTQLGSLMDGHCTALFLQNNGSVEPYCGITNYSSYKDSSYYILPTSANPLHKGHLHMANFVSSIRDIDDVPIHCEFELSMTNVDKDDLSVDETYYRLKQFMELGRKCWITKFTTFAQKAHFFQECQFIVGTDTANRIINPKYYYDCKEERNKVMYDISNQNCSFMVLGRPGYEIDPYCIKMNHLFFIEGYDGYDISSTKIRDKPELKIWQQPGRSNW